MFDVGVFALWAQLFGGRVCSGQTAAEHCGLRDSWKYSLSVKLLPTDLPASKFSTNREARYRKKLLPRVPHPGIISFIGEDQDVLIFQHLPLPDPLEAFPRGCARKTVPSMFCVITLEMWTTLKWKKI